MDPVSQGAFGAGWAQSAAANNRLLPATLIGAASGIAPDLDIFIRSSTDPILFLEYHRHFTHALVFIPIGALICALALHRLVGAPFSFRQTYLFAFLGFASHGLLDACTTYGTLLLWPFSNARIAWNNVSVVDPLFTLPVLGLLALALKRRRRAYSIIAVGWAALYLVIGVVQHERAVAAVSSLAESRGHSASRVQAMPSIANLILWRSIYVHDDEIYVDAIRVWGGTKVFAGGSAEVLDVDRHLPLLEPGSQQTDDLERFRHFANDYLAVMPSRPDMVWDMRYAVLPNEVEGIWGIKFTALPAIGEHVEFVTNRGLEPRRAQDLFSMLLAR